MKRTPIVTIRAWYEALNVAQIDYLQNQLGYLPDTTDNKSLREFYYDANGIRICDTCGSEMNEGYMTTDNFNHKGDYFCSDDCLLKAYNGDAKEMEADRKLFGTEDEAFFYTDWYGDDLTESLEQYAEMAIA